MLSVLKAGHVCGAGSWLNLHNVQSFLCCHFDLVNPEIWKADAEGR